jgi:4-amino-4-deoxy-L-arabinose transferase-like glycosyltransferase
MKPNSLQHLRRPTSSHRIVESRSYALLAIVGGACVLRVVGLGRWPEFTADEGLWTNSTKNFLLFRDWFMGGQTHLLLSPVFHGLSLLLFHVFGPSIATARYLSALAGTTSVVLLWALVRRMADDGQLALVTSALFGLNEMTVQMARLAQTEALQLCFMLASLWLLTSESRRHATFGGIMLALACLTKINSMLIVLVFAAWVVTPALENPQARRSRLSRAAAASFIGLTITAAVLGFLFVQFPERMIAAYSFELNGVHFRPLSKPLVTFGLFGFSPGLSARTVLRLFREAPYLMVLSSLGLAITMRGEERRGGSFMFGAWYLAGFAFLLGQIYQPLHYFYLLTPSIAYFAAVAVCAGRPSSEVGREQFDRRLRTALCVYAVFSVVYVGAGFAMNGGRLREVTTWVKDFLPRGAVLMAAGYLCTDVPNQAYAFYRYGETPAQMLSSIRMLRVDYVVYDRFEWPEALARALEGRYQVVKRWPFAAVYRVRP